MGLAEEKSGSSSCAAAVDDVGDAAPTWPTPRPSVMLSKKAVGVIIRSGAEQAWELPPPSCFLLLAAEEEAECPMAAAEAAALCC